jgi:hypothetical protein
MVLAVTTEDIGGAEGYMEATSERNLLAAGQELSAAFWKYCDAVKAHFAHPDAVLAPDEFMTFGNLPANLDHSLVRWRKAIAFIEANALVAARNADGREWKDALDPGGLFYFASLARPDDKSYRSRLEIVQAKEAARLERMEDDLSHLCGRPTLSGKPCRKVAAYWPGSGRKAGCSVHLNEAERAQLSSIWDQVVAEFDCPGCSSSAGQECDPDSLVLIDGFYATPKAFNGRSVHSPRLELLTSRHA